MPMYGALPRAAVAPLPVGDRKVEKAWRYVDSLDLLASGIAHANREGILQSVVRTGLVAPEAFEKVQDVVKRGIDCFLSRDPASVGGVSGHGPQRLLPTAPDEVVAEHVGRVFWAIGWIRPPLGVGTWEGWVTHELVLGAGSGSAGGCDARMEANGMRGAGCCRRPPASLSRPSAPTAVKWRGRAAAVSPARGAAAAKREG